MSLFRGGDLSQRQGGRVAAFREHIAVSSMLGLGAGVAAATMLGFQPAEAAVAGVLTGFAGMLPDLDSPTGKPNQELFALTAAISPLVLVGHLLSVMKLPPSTEVMILLMLATYITVRYGMVALVRKFSVHRGMFHSFPALIIAGEITYLVYPSASMGVKFLMASGVAIGFFSHLVLDEIYSIDLAGPVPKFKKSFGTAMKWASPRVFPTIFTYGLLIVMTLAVGEQSGIIGPPVDPETVIAEQPDFLPRIVNRPSEDLPVFAEETTNPQNPFQ